MKQFGLIYIYIYKCYTKIPVSYLKQTKMSFFFFYKMGEQERRIGPVWEGGTSGRGDDVRKGYSRVNFSANTVYTCR
jgi:hypothetical protein